MITVITVPIILVLRVAFSAHDPKRAARHVEVDAEGRFRLELPGPHAGEVFFRFEMRDSNEEAYDLVVRGKVTSTAGTQAFGVRTARSSSIDGGETRHADATLAASGSRGSILLTQVASVPSVVEGRVETRSPGELVRGWVYLPG